MLILTCLFLLVPGTVTGTSTFPRYTVLDWELGYTKCMTPTRMSQYQFPKRCTEPENMIESVKKWFPGVPVTPRRIRIMDQDQPGEIHPGIPTPLCVLVKRICTKKPDVRTLADRKPCLGLKDDWLKICQSGFFSAHIQGGGVCVISPIKSDHK